MERESAGLRVREVGAPGIGLLRTEVKVVFLESKGAGQMQEGIQAQPVNPIRVVIADDHALMRAGLHYVLERMPGVVVVILRFVNRTPPLISVAVAQ